MKSDRMYIQTLDKEVRRLREIVKEKENRNPTNGLSEMGLEDAKDY